MAERIRDIRDGAIEQISGAFAASRGWTLQDQVQHNVQIACSSWPTENIMSEHWCIAKGESPEPRRGQFVRVSIGERACKVQILGELEPVQTESEKL